MKFETGERVTISNDKGTSSGTIAGYDLMSDMYAVMYDLEVKGGKNNVTIFKDSRIEWFKASELKKANETMISKGVKA